MAEIKSVKCEGRLCTYEMEIEGSRTVVTEDTETGKISKIDVPGTNFNQLCLEGNSCDFMAISSRISMRNNFRAQAASLIEEFKGSLPQEIRQAKEKYAAEKTHILVSLSCNDKSVDGQSIGDRELHVTDINGDGHTDEVAFITKGGVKVFLSNSDSSESSCPTDLSAGMLLYLKQFDDLWPPMKTTDLGNTPSTQPENENTDFDLPYGCYT